MCVPRESMVLKGSIERREKSHRNHRLRIEMKKIRDTQKKKKKKKNRI